MPTKEEMNAYKLGEDAFKRDMPKNCNPYPENSTCYEFWKLGWLHGEDLRTKRFF
jgi:hypothetical protein